MAKQLKGRAQAMFLDDNGHIVVTGVPFDDASRTEEEQHNCDAMGCSSVEHVILRAKDFYLGTD